MQRALLACVPLFFGGLGCIFSGLLSVSLEKMPGGTARSRRVLGIAGMGSAGVMILVSMRFSQPVLSVLAVGLASLCSDLALPGAWGACMDVGGRHTGALSGSMNMMGNAGGAVAPMVVPLVLKATGNNWNVNMALFATAYFLGAACWAFVDSDERMHE
jgi:nitrate/nitrite transporter NarK